MSDNRKLEEEETYYSLAAATNYAYCKQHGYDFIYYVPYSSTNVRAIDTTVDPNTGAPRHASWSKIISAMRAVELYDYDYVVYIDSDCIFRNFSAPLESIISQYLDKTMIVWNDIPWHKDKPCAGFFILSSRNKSKATSLLLEWYMYDLPEHNQGRLWEQVALCDMFITRQDIGMRDELMFYEQPGQFIRHICSAQNHMRKPYFSTFLKSMNIDYTTTIDHIDTCIFDTDTYTKPWNLLDMLHIAPNISNTRNVLVTILTSGDIEILEVCFQSVLYQSHKIDICKEVHNTLFHPVVIVNTTNPSYYDEVVKLLREKYNFTNVVQSESNGRPGKGHNSEIEHFKNNPQYDWIFPVDGDDVIYPTAFLQIASLLNTTVPTEQSFDVLLHIGLDCVHKQSLCGSVVIDKGIFMQTIFQETNLLEDRNHVINDPFDVNTPINKLQCPGRIFMLNRKAVTITNPAIHWDEDCEMLEDFRPYLATVYHHKHLNLRVAGTSNRYIYIHNKLNENTVTTKFTYADNDNIARANALFRKSIDFLKSTALASEWESTIRSIPFVATSDDPKFKKCFDNKINFVKHTLLLHYYSKHIKTLQKLFADRDWKQLINTTQSLLDTYAHTVSNNPVLIADIRLNLGVAFFSQQNYVDARQSWVAAASTSNLKPETSRQIQCNLAILDQKEKEKSVVNGRVNI